jgi:bifunctional non-homologous end joining protein LigD
MNSTLKTCRSGRNSGNTSEPPGENRVHGGSRRCVIKKRNATRLHYDFRLETGGVPVFGFPGQFQDADPPVRSRTR